MHWLYPGAVPPTGRAPHMIGIAMRVEVVLGAGVAAVAVLSQYTVELLINII